MLSAITFIHWPEEIDYLEPCLKSLSFVDEIIVINHGAPGSVVKLAKKYGRVVETGSSDFAQHHNLGKEEARGDWLLYVDSDERISKKLSDDIKNIDGSFDAFQLRRVNYYLGKEARFGDRVPDYVARLFKKDRLKGWAGEIHESSIVDGKIGKLEAPLYHLSHRNIYSMVEKTINFSEHEGILRQRLGHPPIVGWRLIRVFLTEFFNRIIKMQGWRQGTEGWIDGIFQAFSLFIVYVRLWELQRPEPLAKTYQKIDEKILSGEI